MTILRTFSPSTEGLSELPELTTAAVEAARWNPGAGCLIDRAYPDLPLVISFGFREFQNLPAFDFFKRTKKLEKLRGLKFNKILVRDVFNSWYHRGVPGLGTDLDEVTATLHTLIDAIRPCRVVTIGQSMGAYAAVMYGMLLGADRIAAFGPLSHLDPEQALRYGDLGFFSAMQELKTDPPRSRQDDLVQLGRDLDFQGNLHVIFGTHPRDDDGTSSNFDAVHALRLAQLPNVSLHPYPEADHGIMQWLIENAKIDDLLARLLAGDGEAPGSKSDHA